MPRRPAKKTKRIQKLAPVLLFIVSALFLGGLAFFKSINKPFASADSSTSFDINNSELSTVLLITVENLHDENIKTTALDLVIFDRKDKEVVSFDIPLDWQADIPGKYAESTLLKVLPVAMMNAENKMDAAEVLRGTVENKFAFNIDRFILMDESISSSLTDSLKYGKSRGLINFKNLSQLTFSMESDASLSEFYSLYSFVNGLPLDKFKNYKESTEVLENSDFIQNVLRELTFDSKVAIEGKSVAVLNGTDVPGLASFSSKVLTNYGAHVAEIGNTSDRYENTTLVTSSMDLEIIKQIKRFFNVKEVILKEDFEGGEFAVDREEVSLIIGLDTVDSL